MRLQFETNKDKEPMIALTRKRFTKQRKLKEDNEDQDKRLERR